MPRRRWSRRASARTPASAIWTTPSASCAKLPCVPANRLAEIENMKTRLTRRAFVVGSLAAGFALAVMPVSADTIPTDSNGLIAGEIKIPVAGGEIPAYRAMPASGGPFPTVLVVMEIFGVHEWVKDICRRLAKAGYYAIAPSLCARQGDPSTYTDIPKLVADIVVKVPTDEVMSDLDATVVYAKSTGKADTK